MKPFRRLRKAPIEAKSVGTITTENDPLKIGHIDESPKDASYETPVKNF